MNSLDYTTVDRADPHNCNVYVGNISQEVSDADLRHHFGQFGSITDVKIYRKGPVLFASNCMRFATIWHVQDSLMLDVLSNDSLIWPFYAVGLCTLWGMHAICHAMLHTLCC